MKKRNVGRNSWVAGLFIYGTFLYLCQGLVQTAKVLLDHGAVVYHRDNFGNTPIEEGHQCSFRDVMDPFFAKYGGKFPERKMYHFSMVLDDSMFNN